MPPLQQVWFGAFTGVVPFAIGAYEFTKRIVRGGSSSTGYRVVWANGAGPPAAGGRKAVCHQDTKKGAVRLASTLAATPADGAD